MATPVWIPNTLCLVPDSFGICPYITAEVDDLNFVELVAR